MVDAHFFPDNVSLIRYIQFNVQVMYINMDVLNKCILGLVCLRNNHDNNNKKNTIILHFTVMCLVAKPLNRSEARVDFVVIQTLLLFICTSLCYHAN